MKKRTRWSVAAALALAAAALMALPQPAFAEGHELKVQVFKEGTWSAGKGEWIAGATVTVNPRVGKKNTNKAGAAVFDGVPASKPGGTYDISVSKKDCKDATRAFKMGAYDQVVNIELTCKIGS